MRQAIKNPHVPAWSAVVIAVAGVVGGVISYLENREEARAAKKEAESVKTQTAEIALAEAIEQIRAELEMKAWQDRVERRIGRLEERHRFRSSADADDAAPEPVAEGWKLRQKAYKRLESRGHNMEDLEQ